MAFTLNQEEVMLHLKHKEGITNVKVTDEYVYFYSMSMNNEFRIDTVDPSIVEEFIKIRDNDVQKRKREEELRKEQIEKEAEARRIREKERLAIQKTAEVNRQKLLQIRNDKKKAYENERKELEKNEFCTEEFICEFRYLYQKKTVPAQKQRFGTIQLCKIYMTEVSKKNDDNITAHAFILDKNFPIVHIDIRKRQVLIARDDYDEYMWISLDSLSSITIGIEINDVLIEATYDNKYDVLELDVDGDKREYKNGKVFLEDMFKLFEEE